MTIHTKNILGIPHRRCRDCGKWIPYKVNNITKARCIDCTHKRDSINSKVKRDNLFDNKYDPELIKKELKGGLVPGLFTGCTEEQITAMRLGDVNKLLKAKRRDER